MMFKKTSKSDRPVVENSAQARKRAGKIRSRGGVVALDLDGSRVHAALADYSGLKGRIQQVGTEDLGLEVVLGKTDAKQLGAAIATALKRRKIKGSQVLFVVPRNQVVLRPLSVPFVPDLGELSAMVHLQMAKDLPFKLEEGILDFKVLRVLEPGGVADGAPENAPAPASGADSKQTVDAGLTDKSGAGSESAGEGDGGEAPEAPMRRVEVMVGAVKRELCAYYQTVAEAAGLKLAGLVLRSHGSARLVIRMRPPAPDMAAALIVLRREEITIDLIVGSMLVFSRMAMLRPPAEETTAPVEATTAPVAGSTQTPPAAAEVGNDASPIPVPDKEPVVPEKAGEPLDDVSDGESVDLVRPNPEERRDRFLTALGTELLRSTASYDGMMWRRPLRQIHVGGDTGWEDRVAEYLSRKTGLPATVLDPASALESRRTADASSLRGTLAAVGGALYYEEEGGPPLDFLHPKKPPVRRDTRRLKIMGAAVAVLALLFGLVGVRRHLVQQQVLIKKELQAKVTDAEKKLPVYRRLLAQGGVVRTWMEEGQSWMAHLGLLSGTLPGAEDLYLTSFTTTPQGLIRMSVQARSSDLLVDLDKRLRAAGYDVKPLSITPGNDKHGYPFRTTVELAVPRSMKIDLKEVNVPVRPEDDTPVSLPRTASR